jgi:hypothetical protein
MAPKPKKNANKPYKPTLADQYETRRSWLIETAETPADKKRLKKDLAIAKSDYVNAKKDKQSRAAGTGYNPAPMSAKAKAAAKAVGAKKKEVSKIRKVASMISPISTAKRAAKPKQTVDLPTARMRESRKPVPMPTVASGGRTAKPMPMMGPKKKSSGTAGPVKPKMSKKFNKG